MHETRDNPIELDFRRRDTESGWLKTLDRFGLAAAPTWFAWLEWILVLGAFEYLAGRSGRALPGLISALSIGILWFYFNGFFFRIRLRAGSAYGLFVSSALFRLAYPRFSPVAFGLRRMLFRKLLQRTPNSPWRREPQDNVQNSLGS